MLWYCHVVVSAFAYWFLLSTKSLGTRSDGRPPKSPLPGARGEHVRGGESAHTACPASPLGGRRLPPAPGGSRGLLASERTPSALSVQTWSKAGPQAALTPAHPGGLLPASGFPGRPCVWSVSLWAPARPSLFRTALITLGGFCRLCIPASALLLTCEGFL